ncbi:hypothetical protein E4T52_08059 [Aureobasidium sp. EXF-3400]|nr:hypothetical protein E4T51_07018 [Aureobasidium sp. EXF-12344]KAI4776991.1 hypothetical protein E4T52_08059 [Aureobasidium sp. EXF-3400]
MMKTAVLVGIFVPIVIYFCIAAVILFVLGCAMYVYIIKFRELIQRTYRKLKLRYWPEQTFDFLALPPEIRLMIYRYMLPEDRIYYMTARKQRFASRSPPKELNNEIIPRPLPLLRVCRLVHQEFWQLIYHQCIFYITIYSIRDLLYVVNLLDKCTASHHTLRDKDIFCHMGHIRIRVSDLILDIYAVHRLYDRSRLEKYTQTTRLWIGPGAGLLLESSTQTVRMVNQCRQYDIDWLHSGAASVKQTIRWKLLMTPIVDGAILRSMLPWYQRDQG